MVRLIMMMKIEVGLQEEKYAGTSPARNDLRINFNDDDRLHRECVRETVLPV